jgi:hypothetical protein
MWKIFAAWRRILRRKRRRASDAGAESDGYDEDGSSDSDYLTRPLSPMTFGRTLRLLLERQQRLPWATHPLSTVMKIEPYRQFKYCKGSGEYTAFEVTGNTDVYLASFTVNGAPGIRL